MIRSNLKRIERRAGDSETAEPKEEGSAASPTAAAATVWPLLRRCPTRRLPPRRSGGSFTAEYKLAILAEADACGEEGAIGALLGVACDGWCTVPINLCKPHPVDLMPVDGASLVARCWPRRNCQRWRLFTLCVPMGDYLVAVTLP